MSWRYHCKTLIKGEPKDIFPLISTSEGFIKWFLRNCELECKPGGRLYLEWSGGESAEGKVVEVVQNERFAYEWAYEPQGFTTRVDMWLEPTDAGTIFHLEENGFPEKMEYAALFNSITQGWTEFVFNIKSVVMYGNDLRDEWT